jgi:hypothetical protein
VPATALIPITCAANGIASELSSFGEEILTGDQRTFLPSELQDANLVVDAVYQGGRSGNAGDDPLNALLTVSLMGGFRYRGSLDNLELVVLTTTLSDVDWPDSIDRETGVFTYFGDNKKPGQELHGTPRHGNEILRNLFGMAHGSSSDRQRLPPVFIFHSTGSYRDMRFAGLAVPGTSDLRASEDLVAIWRVAAGRRFQNYRARFTILDVPVVSRSWISDVLACNPLSKNAPAAWSSWIASGDRRPLLATRSNEKYRNKVEQLPTDAEGKAIVAAIHTWFEGRSHDFEYCAASLTRMMLPDIASIDVTRPSRDGGRDALGKLRLGREAASILVDFAVEAKCYKPGSPVGVREVSRLISRLRNRQFGVLVTTSYLDAQAYREVTEDQHPVIVMAGADIVQLLRANGRADVNSVREWLQTEYPRRPE